ncbi:MAG TPA: hypothetical protein VH985_10925 [Candidatus Binatia bacterium]
MRHVEKNRIAGLQVFLGDGIQRPVKAWPQLLIGPSIPRMEKESIYDVIVVEINGPETPKNFSRQGGLAGAGYAHDQNQMGLR